MPYQWPLDPRDVFAERYPQMVNTGLPASDVDAVRAAVAAMWPDEPGGWVHEWSTRAAKYAADGRHELAALAYGWAKFPVLADTPKRVAFQRQIDEYLLAATDFPMRFERRVLDLPYGGTVLAVPVHLFTAPGTAADAPVLLASGGVDGWKIDLHQILLTLAAHTGAHVLAFDIPGTGETRIPLSRESTGLIDSLIVAAREMGNGIVAHLGFSMGGYFSAYSGLSGKADAAVVIGGPVQAAFAPDRTWQVGMADIVAHALGFEQRPTAAEIVARASAMSLDALLEQRSNAPMFVVNGADDIHIPRADTLVFSGRPDTRVESIAGSGHCAMSELGVVMPEVIGWLTGRLR
ncbi:alpha/beta fold hydrolase [Nocardia seriolae]|uniref:Uncharacterized protein n=1 Tax=Nocardia seriolae TaxID=37332 RepID=A0A0B8N4B3_9NOCA|nr:alpha/beta hydrolase [Nocardia seriolae]APB00310.1 hypothetical protein NS506_06274 [Nocardia seriolae]MTJ64979.1 alpha/beta hydrolase [Nocardia seriolae]MTJ71833.1 alpha/beta hydrolase [Nocardia seriolae]MTJ89793.1 alpha/beta hydrolase [Nocardia seriolae]MTK33769.1 alpha/beta hydrolase [Nocardia seriolae]